MPEIELDRIDRRILQELQRDGRLSNQALAERVALSPSPCLRRVKRLEELGVIRQYTALLDPEKVGFGLTGFIEVRLQKHAGGSHSPITEFTRDVQTWPEVIQCYATTGDMDYLLRVHVRDLAHFSRFALDTLMHHPSVVDMRSSFILKEIKNTTVLEV